MSIFTAGKKILSLFGVCRLKFFLQLVGLMSASLTHKVASVPDGTCTSILYCQREARNAMKNHKPHLSESDEFEKLF